MLFTSAALCALGQITVSATLVSFLGLEEEYHDFTQTDEGLKSDYTTVHSLFTCQYDSLQMLGQICSEKPEMEEWSKRQDTWVGAC